MSAIVTVLFQGFLIGTVLIIGIAMLLEAREWWRLR